MTNRAIRFPLAPRFLRFCIVIITLIGIVYFSLITMPPEAPTQQPLWDKYLHFVAYAGFAATMAYATVDLRDRPIRRGVFVIGSTITVGILIELSQGLIPYRYFRWTDIVANTLGSVLVSIWFLVERRIRYVPVRRLITELTAE